MGSSLVSENAPIFEHSDSKVVTIDAVQIRALRVVVAVADRGGFAAAGRHLHLPRATISRIVGHLEEKTGVRLFRRNTRKVVPTEAGEALIEAARNALLVIDAAMEPGNMDRAELSGAIRVSVSHAFGRRFVLPAIGGFRDRHPRVHVEAVLEDRLDDMVEEDIDLAVRLGPLPETDMVIRRVGAIRSGLFAAPSFLEGLEQPVSRSTLDRVPAIGFRVPGTGRIMSWPVNEDRSVTRSVVPRIVASSGSIEAVADMAREGFGLALLPRYLVDADVVEERLRDVLPDHVSLSTDVHICLKETRFMPARTRAFIDHLAREIGTALRGAS